MRSLAPTEPGVRRFEATVRRVRDRAVVLDETYFYPEGGGQPADRGTLGGVAVEHVETTDGEVVHRLAEPPGFGTGEPVVGVVDDAFRTYCARAHTASHALFGAGRRLCADLGYGGFDIDEAKVRVDLRTPTDVDDDLLVELERLTNRTVWDSRDVTWESVPADEARAREDVAFNTRTEEGVMADAGTVRLVTIEGWDVAACGGTHVRNTREIGPVAVLDRSNPGEGLTRVEFAVGPPAIGRLADVHRSALAAARELGTGVADLAGATAALREERDALAAEVTDLTDEVLAGRVADLPTVERDGRRWRVGAVEGFGPNEVGDRVRGRPDDGEVVAVTGEADGTAYLVVAAPGEPDAAAVVADVTDEFGGGGGGGPAFAQGGGIPATPEAVADYLRERAD
ncbi:MAG: alanine--tRNA ligase-related protein [Haloferacaceae archaeon]